MKKRSQVIDIVEFLYFTLILFYLMNFVAKLTKGQIVSVCIVIVNYMKKWVKMGVMNLI